MTARPLVLVIAGLLALAVQAAPPPAPPENLPAAMRRQVEDVLALKQKTDDAAAALRKWYESALDVLKKNAQAKGDLDAVLATDTERERMSRDLTNQEKANLPLASLQVRNQFDQARAAQAGQEKAATLVLLRGYVATLEALEKRLTQKSDIEGALATRKERTAAAQQLSNATPLPGDLLALEGPKSAATPAAPAPAVSPRPVATPAPVPAATPALLASRTMPPSGLSRPGPAPVISVASELKAKGTIQNPAPEAIAFNGPDGDGRRASRCVLLKNEPDTGKNGTTWAFTYTTHGEAVQIVHPHGRGQVVVNLRAKEASISTPATWSQAGKGDPKKIKILREAASIFPLMDDQPHKVVSALSPSGGFTLTIDAKVVATGRVGTATSVQLGVGFADPAPDRLAPGNAMLFVGPVDSGQNVCRDITFQASAAEPPH